MADIQRLIANFSQAGQSHVFTYLSELSPEQKQAFLKEIASTDLQAMKFLFQKLFLNPDPEVHSQIEPYSNYTRLSDLSGDHISQLRQEGIQLLSSNNVGLIMLAGGQASRLGVSYPKGMYDISLISHKTFFQIYAQKILKLKQISNSQNHLPWAIMTNTQTCSQVLNFFRQNHFFGLDPNQVNIFSQDMIPALDFEGKILMADKHRLVLSPNGNGGAFESLGKKGVINWFQQKGVTYVHFCGVDNILLKICDPVLLGFTHNQDVQVSTKTVEKTDPKDQMGVLGLKGGKQSVVQYSQLSEAMAQQKTPQGKLAYGLGNILNHIFKLDFIKRVLSNHLPDLRSKYHLARKKVPHFADREFYKPTEPNGLKFQLFYFDILPLAASSAALVVDRQSEFAPVKNAEGPDSPESARKLVARLHSRWAEQAGAILPDLGKENCYCEISPNISYDGEGLEFLANQRIEFPFYLYYQMGCCQMIEKQEDFYMQRIIMMTNEEDWIGTESFGSSRGGSQLEVASCNSGVLDIWKQEFQGLESKIAVNKQEIQG